MMRNLRIYFLNNFQIYSRFNYIYNVVHYIPCTYLSYTWEFVPFDCFHSVPQPSTSGYHKSDLFFYLFIYLFIYFNIFIEV